MIKIKKNELMNTCNCYAIGYCDAQHILAPLRFNFYTTRQEGWACDVAILDDNITAITTGYAPFGQHLPYNFIKKWDDKAKKVNSWSQRKRLCTLFLKKIKAGAYD